MKFGIVGTNFVSDWFAEAASSVENAEIVAVYSRHRETGAAFARRHGIKSVFTDYGEMLSSDIEAVYVASPTYLHESQAILAMERGKQVLCEKMMACSYQGALRMVEAAKRYNVTLIEAMRPNFDPATAVIFAKSRELGTIRRSHFEYCQYSSRYDRFKMGEVLNAFDPEICNSALADIGIYPLNMAVSLFGAPRSIQAKAVFLHNGFEGMGSLSLDYLDMLCDITYSKITEGTGYSFIEGENGTLFFDRVNSPTKIMMHMRGRAVEEIPFERVEHNMTCEVKAFIEIASGRASGRAYLDATIEAIRIANEAYIKTGAIRFMDESLMS